MNNNTHAHTRPTWLTLLVGTATGYGIAQHDLIHLFFIGTVWMYATGAVVAVAAITMFVCGCVRIQADRKRRW